MPFTLPVFLDLITVIPSGKVFNPHPLPNWWSATALILIRSSLLAGS
jgi:hypothetical protein